MVDLSILMSYVNVSKIEGIFGVVKFTPSNGAFVAAIPNHDGGMRREASHLSPFFFRWFSGLKKNMKVIPSGKLTWKITIFTGKTHYFQSDTLW